MCGVVAVDSATEWFSLLCSKYVAAPTSRGLTGACILVGQVDAVGEAPAGEAQAARVKLLGRECGKML